MKILNWWCLDPGFVRQFRTKQVYRPGFHPQFIAFLFCDLILCCSEQSTILPWRHPLFSIISLIQWCISATMIIIAEFLLQFCNAEAYDKMQADMVSAKENLMKILQSKDRKSTVWSSPFFAFFLCFETFAELVSEPIYCMCCSSIYFLILYTSHIRNFKCKPQLS